ncbi:MAG: hypothetical protein HQ542_01080 [Bacteroidia bacterium]|nr:hypothetical protein [Bacteroidia bacterium]
MRIISFTLLFSLLITLGYSQRLEEADLPAAVKQTIGFHYPHIYDPTMKFNTVESTVTYEKIGDSYRADLMVSDAPAYIVVGKDGKLIRKAYQIPTSSVTNAIKKTLKSNYQDVKVLSLYIVSEVFGRDDYQVTFEGAGYYTPEGEVTSMVKDSLSKVGVKKVPQKILDKLDSGFAEYTLNSAYRAPNKAGGETYKLLFVATDFYSQGGVKITGKLENL